MPHPELSTSRLSRRPGGTGDLRADGVETGLETRDIFIGREQRLDVGTVMLTGGGGTPGGHQHEQ